MVDLSHWSSSLPFRRRVASSAAVLGVCSLLTACGSTADRERSPNRSASAQPETPVLAPSPAADRERWRDEVFYEVFVRSFADATFGPLAGDGIGDLRGLAERLDYLNDGNPGRGDDLEVGGLWLMPVMESPSYHGYDVTDYEAVEEDYGTQEDLRELITEAHRRGLRVIVDLPLNHTSVEHPWFRDALHAGSAHHDWYLWATERQGYLGPWGEQVWHQLPWWRRGLNHWNYLAYYGIFSPGMPDLNYRNPQVTAAMYEVARYWLETMGADGFRLDAARHLVEEGEVQSDTVATHDWLRRFHTFVHRLRPEALLVGEVWTDTATVATYGPDELDLLFQFDLAAATLRAITFGGAEPLAAAVQEVSDRLPPSQLATFLTNHDQVRVASDLNGDLRKERLAAALLLTGPGTPFLYYGEEIGMSGVKPDPLLRTPMQWSGDPNGGFSTHRPWEPLRPDYRERNVAVEAADPDSLLSAYRRLIRLRRELPVLRRGTFQVIPSGNPQVFAFRRSLGEAAAVVVANLDASPVDDYGLEVEPLTVEGRELGEGRQVEVTPGAAGKPWRPMPELAPYRIYLFR